MTDSFTQSDFRVVAQEAKNKLLNTLKKIQNANSNFDE